MTTSAASDDALAPRAPMATPTSAAAKAGASLIPSPTIRVGCEPLLDCDGVDLVGGDSIGEHGVEVESRADRLGRVGAIARHHDDPRHARGAQGLNRARRFAPQLVREQQGGDRPSVHGYEDA